MVVEELGERVVDGVEELLPTDLPFIHLLHFHY